MQSLRTPDEQFSGLPDYDFHPHYTEIPDSLGGTLRVHHIEEGEGPVVLLMHGEPSWSYLYRRMIPILRDAGFRAVAPDLIGFGRSDKPAERADYTYQRHVDWMRAWLVAQDLQDITLFCQDWGGLIGLRLLALEEQRFARVVAANTFLPAGKVIDNEAFLRWRDFAANSPKFQIGRVIDNASVAEIAPEIQAAYDAPFPDETYTAGARSFPGLVPIGPEDVAVPGCLQAWEVLSRWDKPFLTAFSDSDPITGGFDKVFQKKVPGAQNQPHTIIKGAGHFLQEEKGEELANVIINFVKG